jgi:hypothetical protein
MMTPVPRSIVIAFFAASVACAALPAVAQGTTDGTSKRQVKAVVELFTSQGCSSCPKADALMESNYAKRADVLALSFSVDYWDYIGWKDTNARPGNTVRQRDYAKARGDGAVYTPQMVVNGAVHAVGSNAADIDKAIGKTASFVQSDWVPLTVNTSAAGSVTIVAGQGGQGVKAAQDGRLILVGLKRHSNVKIERGENAGRAISYTNVVREFKQVGTWSGTAVSFSIPADQMANAACDAYAVILQRGAAGPVIGAATIGNW